MLIDRSVLPATAGSVRNSGTVVGYWVSLWHVALATVSGRVPYPVRVPIFPHTLLIAK